MINVDYAPTFTPSLVYLMALTVPSKGGKLVRKAAKKTILQCMSDLMITLCALLETVYYLIFVLEVLPDSMPSRLLVPAKNGLQARFSGRDQYQFAALN